MAFSPPKLSYFSIYAPSLGTTDITVENQIIFYYSPASANKPQFLFPQKDYYDQNNQEQNQNNEQNQNQYLVEDDDFFNSAKQSMLKQIGLAQGIVEFSYKFSSVKKNNSLNDTHFELIETSSSRIIVLELEPGWWAIASVLLPKHIETNINNTTTPYKIHSTEKISNAEILQQQIRHVYNCFTLSHGKFSSFINNSNSNSLNKLIKYSKQWWLPFLTTWNLSISQTGILAYWQAKSIRLPVRTLHFNTINVIDTFILQREAINNNLLGLIICQFPGFETANSISNPQSNTINSVTNSSMDCDSGVLYLKSYNNYISHDSLTNVARYVCQSKGHLYSYEIDLNNVQNYIKTLDLSLAENNQQITNSSSSKSLSQFSNNTPINVNQSSFITSENGIPSSKSWSNGFYDMMSYMSMGSLSSLGSYVPIPFSNTSLQDNSSDSNFTSSNISNKPYSKSYTKKLAALVATEAINYSNPKDISEGEFLIGYTGKLEDDENNINEESHPNMQKIDDNITKRSFFVKTNIENYKKDKVDDGILSKFSSESLGNNHNCKNESDVVLSICQDKNINQGKKTKYIYDNQESEGEINLENEDKNSIDSEKYEKVYVLVYRQYPYVFTLLYSEKAEKSLSEKSFYIDLHNKLASVVVPMSDSLRPNTLDDPDELQNNPSSLSTNEMSFNNDNNNNNNNNNDNNINDNDNIHTYTPLENISQESTCNNASTILSSSSAQITIEDDESSYIRSTSTITKSIPSSFFYIVYDQEKETIESTLPPIPPLQNKIETYNDDSKKNQQNINKNNSKTGIINEGEIWSRNEAIHVHSQIGLIFEAFKNRHKNDKEDKNNNKNKYRKNLKSNINEIDSEMVFTKNAIILEEITARTAHGWWIIYVILSNGLEVVIVRAATRNSIKFAAAASATIAGIAASSPYSPTMKSLKKKISTSQSCRKLKEQSLNRKTSYSSLKSINTIATNSSRGTRNLQYDSNYENSILNDNDSTTKDDNKNKNKNKNNNRETSSMLDSKWLTFGLINYSSKNSEDAKSTGYNKSDLINKDQKSAIATSLRNKLQPGEDTLARALGPEARSWLEKLCNYERYI